MADPIAILKAWDYHSGQQSIATTLAVEWAQKLNPVIQRVYIDQGEKDQVTNTQNFADTASAKQLLEPLVLVIKELSEKFGKWQLPWGEINRYQRLNNNLVENFNDSMPSIPIGFTGSTWGQLPAFKSTYSKGNNKRYGIGGNSFICAVEFGKKVKAKSLLAGGESGSVNSIHFKDQAEMYAHGQFKEVLFYPEDLAAHVEKKYHPGE